jgi:hypothetical protein
MNSLYAFKRKYFRNTRQTVTFRIPLNICSFVRQCNTFTSQTLSRHVSASWPLAHGWQYHIGENWHNRATTSGGEYSITTEDGRVRPKHVLIEFKK